MVRFRFSAYFFKPSVNFSCGDFGRTRKLNTCVFILNLQNKFISNKTTVQTRVTFKFVLT